MSTETQVLTKSKLWKVVITSVVTLAIAMGGGFITWITTSILSLQNDATEIKTMLKERFGDKPNDMALWEQIKKHEEQIISLRISSGVSEKLWEAIDKKVENTPAPNIKDDQEKPSIEDTKTFRDKAIRPWVQQKK